MKMITLHSRVSLREGFQTMDVDDATIVAGESRGDCYGLELIARRIWQLLRQESTVAELCDALMNEYEVDRATCEREVLEFLNDSTHEGLIRVAD
jgi:hypothetical protein